MTSLTCFQTKFERRANALNSAFQRLAANRLHFKKLDRFAMQEGLISSMWQSWNSFSRSVIIWSLKGATTANGVAVNSAYSANSIDEIRFIVSRVARNQSIGNPRPIAGYHAEPTWGDLLKVNDIITTLLPSNISQLSSAFGSSVLITDVQKVRNACAHISSDRLADIRSLQVRYNNNRFIHPSDALFWIEPTSGDFAWYVWLDEMKLVASAAVA